MAVFNTISKSPISWDAPPPAERAGAARELLIGGGYKLDIGGGYNLTIQSATIAIQYTAVQKSQGGHTWPQTTPDFQYDLLIGGGYKLGIGDGYTLAIAEFSRGTDWTPISRNPVKY